MAKLGKWSTGLKGSVKDAGPAYGRGNGGYFNRQRMNQFRDQDSTLSRGTATGNLMMQKVRDMKRFG